MSPAEVQWIKFKRRLRRWTLTAWDRLTGGKRHQATQRIIIELIEREKAWEALDQERLNEFKRINSQSGLTEQQYCSELEACASRYLEKMISKAFELREASLNEVPSVAWPPHFDDLRDNLNQWAQRFLGSIPIEVRQKSLLYPSGGRQAHGREADHFLLQKFQVRINQEIYLLQKKAELAKVNKNSRQEAEAKKANRIAIAGIIIAAVVAVAIAWWQVSESRSQAAKPSQPQTETRQDSKVQSSPNATVIQSGRDTIINNPPPKVEVKPEPKTEARPPGQANLTPVPKLNAVQTMVNSPGGVQALGNVTVSSDRRLIHTLLLKLVMDLETPELPVTQPGDPTRNLWFGPGLGVFSKDKTLYRFASESEFECEQVAPTLRRYTFAYRPKSLEQLLGKPIEDLAGIDRLGINAIEFLQIASQSLSPSGKQPLSLGKLGAFLSFTLFVNGVPVANFSGHVKPIGALTETEMSMDVERAFSSIPSAYAAVASR